MKSVSKLISRFIGLLILSILLLLVTNAILAVVVIQQQLSEQASFNGSPYNYTQTMATHFSKLETTYQLDSQFSEKIKTDNVWGIIIDDASKQVVWASDNLPTNIPQGYTLSDISNLTVGYIEDYPTYVSKVDDGLLVLGFPKNSYWKMIRPSWPYRFIENAPQLLLLILVINLIVLLFIYLWFNGKMLHSVAPILEGIKKLTTNQRTDVSERGALSEIAENINQTSKILEEQNNQLSKKEAARADWITGISHDIRTPLSMVIGYASQLSNSSSIQTEESKKLNIILNQSQRIQQLVSDLNLSSKLEYSMQPMNLKKINLLSLVREIVVAFINNDFNDMYRIEYQIADSLHSCFIQADADLIKRAITNIIQNAINHNPDGCIIYISLKEEGINVLLTIEDNGIGVSPLHLNKLNRSSHYMISKDASIEQPHGLGLLIVRQIIEAHKGKVNLGISDYGGFLVNIVLVKL